MSGLRKTPVCIEKTEKSSSRSCEPSSSRLIGGFFASTPARLLEKRVYEPIAIPLKQASMPPPAPDRMGPHRTA